MHHKRSEQEAFKAFKENATFKQNMNYRMWSQLVHSVEKEADARIRFQVTMCESLGQNSKLLSFSLSSWSSSELLLGVFGVNLYKS